jgi:hypothetical protein
LKMTNTLLKQIEQRRASEVPVPVWKWRWI